MENTQIQEQKPKFKPSGPLGQRNGQAKLTDAAVIGILTRLGCGCSVAEVAEEYGISPATVYLIKKGIRWKHIVRPDTDTVERLGAAVGK
jgi:DNA-binding NarL/FixJ family response regulator